MIMATWDNEVVMNLTSHLQGKNHHIYCDNFFSSPKLFDQLHKINIYACGTIRQNTDNKVLSTNVRPGEVDTCERKQKNGTYTTYLHCGGGQIREVHARS